MYNGKKILINIEGIDGTGKNTVSEELLKLYQNKYKVVKTSFPDYVSFTGQLIKNMQQGYVFGDIKHIDPKIVSYPYLIDRMAYFIQKPQIFDNDIIISDRSYMSNFFYQCCKYVNKASDLLTYDSTFISVFDKISAFLNSMQEIETTPFIEKNFIILNFYLYHPDINTNMELIEKRGREKDLNEDLTYLQKIQDFAMTIANIDDLTDDKIVHHFFTWLFEQYKYYEYTTVPCSFLNEDNNEMELFKPSEISEYINILIQEKLS